MNTLISENAVRTYSSKHWASVNLENLQFPPLPLTLLLYKSRLIYCAVLILS